MQYIDSLKSRKYKAFIEKTNIRSDKLYLSLVNSTIVMLLALKQICNNSSLRFNEFELGYIIFCLSNAYYLDVGIFHYYRKTKHLNLLKVLQTLVTKMHYFLILFLLEGYLSHIRYICSISFLKIYKVDDLLFNIEKSQSYKYNYYLHLNIKNYVNSLSVSVLLTKILSHQGISDILLKFFNISDLNYLMSCLVVSKNFLFLEKNRLLKLIIEIFILQIHYELYILFDYHNSILSSLNRIISLYNFDFLLFLFDDSFQWLHLKDNILYIVEASGISLKMNKDLCRHYLSDGVSTNLFLINVQYKVYPFNLTLRPSLKYQFELMRQVSFIVEKSKSSTFPLIAIRLNMLILLWSNLFIQQPVKKIFYLLDYLIKLKLRNKSKYHLQIKYLCIKSSPEDLDNKKINYIVINKCLNFFILISYKHYYKFYAIAKLLWLYKLKC